MDALVAVAIILVIIASGAILFVTSFKLPNIPGPGILEYFPGGVVNPIFADQRTVSRVLYSLSEKYGDVYQVRLGPTVVVLSSVPEDVIQILTDTSAFARPDALTAAFSTFAPGGIFTMEKELHTETRKKLRPSFNYPMLESFHTRMTESINELCDTLTTLASQAHGGGPRALVDISEQIAVTTFGIIMNVAFGFGMSREERKEFSETVDTLVDELMKEFVGYPVRQYLTAFGARNTLLESRQKVRSVCERFIDMRLKETKEQRDARHRDILDVVLELGENDTMKTMALVVEFTLAGYYTTNQMLAWTVYEMCCDPETVENVEKELGEVLGERPLSEPVTPEDMKQLHYLGKCWKETLRLHSVGAGVMRQTGEDVTLKGSGTWIPKGTRVMAHTDRAQRRGEIWSEGMRYKPGRFGSGGDTRAGDRVPAGANVPFGVGARSCAGRFLADYEGPLILAELYRRFRFTLGCEPGGVVNCSCFVDTPKSARTAGGPLDMGVPVRVELRSAQ